VGRPVERALIVEDSRSLARTLEQALASRFGEVRTARSVADAARELATWHPDLVVLDFVLPDGDANAVLDLAAMKEPAPVVVAISGEADAQQTFGLAQRGVRAFLPKPLRLEELEAAIDVAVSTAPDLEPHLRQSVGHRPLHAVEAQARDVMIDEALARAVGSRRGAAKILATSRQLLQYLLRRR
jgi:two-component system response regulator RegA